MTTVKNSIKNTVGPVLIREIAPGGQGVGELPDGRVVFVWNALPEEKAWVRVTKSRHSYAEGVAERIDDPAADREEPEEANYLATSPWQMMNFDAENRYKYDITQKLLQQHHLKLEISGKVHHDERQWHYRNKMEYSFWGDDSGLHLALYSRGTHQKHMVQGSKLAMPAVDNAAKAVCSQLAALAIRAGQLKTIIVRCAQDGTTAAALYVRDEQFPKLGLPPELTGLRVYFSNPKSPASVPTKLLYELGDSKLEDKLLGKQFRYDVDSFFQVNLPMYEQALASIKQTAGGDGIVDMYAGVGSIGLSAAKKSVELVELDSASAAMARENLAASNLQGTVTEADTVDTIQSIPMDRSIIFDPPRAGLHSKVIAACLEKLPPRIIYLSCNPATQFRDLALLTEAYDVAPIDIYNFFPRTPHIETLAILTRRG
jgi:23S rRNA (uracil1939-C5)-methyltransferase